MRIGFIGAGKVGCTLGKYFAVHGADLAGYYDRDARAAAEAAAFVGGEEGSGAGADCPETGTSIAAPLRGGPRAYDSPGRLLADCDAIFLTVPDGRITAAYEELRAMHLQVTAGNGDGAQVQPGTAQSRTVPGLLQGKLLCHCSGSISSRDAFPGVEETGAEACSLHPLFAVSSRFETWEEIGKAVFTLEGASVKREGTTAGVEGTAVGNDRKPGEMAEGTDRLSQMRDFLTGMGLQVQTIDPSAKTRYHLAAVYASNLICGLLGEAQRLLQECGFPAESALQALAPLITGNVDHVLAVGPAAALTGPVERGDLTTVRKHLAVCDSAEDRQRYLLLSQLLLQLAKEKNPDRDYGALEAFLSDASDVPAAPIKNSLQGE